MTFTVLIFCLPLAERKRFSLCIFPLLDDPIYLIQMIQASGCTWNHIQYISYSFQDLLMGRFYCICWMAARLLRNDLQSWFQFNVPTFSDYHDNKNLSIKSSRIKSISVISSDSDYSLMRPEQWFAFAITKQNKMQTKYHKIVFESECALIENLWLIIDKSWLKISRSIIFLPNNQWLIID